MEECTFHFRYNDNDFFSSFLLIAPGGQRQTQFRFLYLSCTCLVIDNKADFDYDFDFDFDALLYSRAPPVVPGAPV